MKKTLLFVVSLSSSLLIFTANQQFSPIVDFYNNTTGTAWICKENTITDLTINDPETNYVLFGPIVANGNITMHVKNLIILELLSAQNIHITTTKDLFNVGKVHTNKKCYFKVECFYNGLNNDAIAKIQALGVDIRFTNTEHTELRLIPPFSS